MVKLLPVLYLVLLLMGCARNNRQVTFRHFPIAHPLPGEGYGTGGFGLADFDGDGDLDVTIQRRSDSTIYFYQRASDSLWTQHMAARFGGGQLGAVVLDVNQDGHVDLVMGRAWIENPAQLDQHPDALWQVHEYRGGLSGENHDIAAADIDQDGVSDVICYSQSAGIIRWYDLDNAGEWKPHDIARDVDSLDVHAGFAPHGVGDLNGDGYPDLIMPYFWYENPGESQGSLWFQHPWPYREIAETPYGRSFRSWIVDLDGDTDQDVVITECDVTMSRAFWYENSENGRQFIEHPLPTPPGPSGSFHSLVVADFDLDGDQDIFIGEQEDDNQSPEPGMKPMGHQERGMLLVNEGTVHEPKFIIQWIHQDNPGWHDTQAGDVDGDGDVDLVTKIWNADEAGIWHADYWRNDLQ